MPTSLARVCRDGIGARRCRGRSGRPRRRPGAEEREGVALYLATVAMGAVFVPVNPGAAPAEHAFMVEDSEPALLVVGDRPGAPAQVPTLTFGADGAGTLAGPRRVRSPRAGRMRASTRSTTLGDVVTAADRRPDDLAAMLYTSGTTGRPKGAMTHRGLVANARALVDAWGFTGDDVLVHTLPIFHVHGLFVALHLRAVDDGTGAVPVTVRRRRRTRCPAQIDRADGRADALRPPARRSPPERPHLHVDAAVHVGIGADDDRHPSALHRPDRPPDRRALRHDRGRIITSNPSTATRARHGRARARRGVDLRRPRRRRPVARARPAWSESGARTSSRGTGTYPNAPPRP